MDYRRMPIEVESPEQLGYDTIKCNLAESSVADATFGEFNVDISSLVLCYGDHKGHPELRSLIAKEANVDKDDVLLVPGAAAGLFIIATSILEKGDGIAVAHPNYATNLETPYAIGARINRIELHFEQQFLPEMKEFQSIDDKTRLVSITNPHNPSGAMMSEAKLREIISTVTDHGKILLVDETYRYMCFDQPPAVAAGINENVISVSSVSKAFGLPGIRIGWIICRNKKLMEKFLAAKEQILICNSMVDEELAFQAFRNRESWLKRIETTVLEKFRIVDKWLSSHHHLEYVKPGGGVVTFPRFKDPQKIDLDKFYNYLLHDLKTLVGPGHWFDMPRHYFRIGFGWPSSEELSAGLNNIDLAIAETFR